MSTPSTKVCPNCGTRIRIAVADCPFCGHDLSAAQPAAPVIITHPRRTVPQTVNANTDDDQMEQAATKTCPDCGMRVRDDAPTCPRCGHDWRAETAVDDSPRSAKRSRWSWVAGGVVAVVLLGAGAFFLPMVIGTTRPAQPSATSTVIPVALLVTSPAPTPPDTPVTATSLPVPTLAAIDVPPTETADATVTVEPSPTIAIAPTASLTPAVALLQGRVVGNKPTVAMRASPSTTANATLQIPLGQIVDVVCQARGDIPIGFPVKSTDKWYKVSSAGQSGYVYNRLLDVTGAVPACQ